MKEWNRQFSHYQTINWIMVWVMISCIALALIPIPTLSQIAQWNNAIKPMISLGLLLSGAYFLSQILIVAWNYVLALKTEKDRKKYLIYMIEHLDFSEKSVLREFVIQRKSVINLPLTEPAVKNLLNAGILDFAYGQPLNDDLSQIKALTISLESRPYITYKALGISSSKMSDEQVEQILSARPKFVTKTTFRS